MAPVRPRVQDPWTCGLGFFILKLFMVVGMVKYFSNFLVQNTRAGWVGWLLLAWWVWVSASERASSFRENDEHEGNTKLWPQTHDLVRSVYWWLGLGSELSGRYSSSTWDLRINERWIEGQRWKVMKSRSDLSKQFQLIPGGVWHWRRWSVCVQEGMNGVKTVTRETCVSFKGCWCDDA